MKRPNSLRPDKLASLARLAGFPDPQALLEASYADSVAWGICTEPGCDYCVEVEPDQDAGWCEACDAGTVASALVLAELI